MSIVIGADQKGRALKDTILTFLKENGIEVIDLTPEGAKDFYDIYLIAENYELDGEILKDAVQETFAHRNTTFNDIFAFKSAFINSPIHNSRWDVFLNKKKATVKVELERVIVIIRDLLLPISESIISGKEFTSIWNNKDRAWQ